jgi:transcription elongation factor Elf1
MTEMDNCPFCKSNRISFYDTGKNREFCVRCEICGAKGPQVAEERKKITDETRALSIREWNKAKR